MKITTRWAWFALACVAVFLAAYMGRNEVQCLDRGCVAVSRFTGKYHRVERQRTPQEMDAARRASLGQDTAR